jgi:hypothetical protein
MKDIYLSPRDINAADFGLDGTDETDCAHAINAVLFQPAFNAGRVARVVNRDFAVAAAGLTAAGCLPCPAWLGRACNQYKPAMTEAGFDFLERCCRRGPRGYIWRKRAARSRRHTAVGAGG